MATIRSIRNETNDRIITAFNDLSPMKLHNDDEDADLFVAAIREAFNAETDAMLAEMPAELSKYLNDDGVRAVQMYQFVTNDTDVQRCKFCQSVLTPEPYLESWGFCSSECEREYGEVNQG